MKSAGASAGAGSQQFDGTPSGYLPTAMLLFAPLAVLPWKAAKTFWLLFNLVAAAWTGRRIFMRTTGWLRDFPVFYWSFLLAFAPLHTAISRGQTSIAVCALIVAGLSAEEPVTSGFLLGLAVCLKPQLAIGFLALPFIARRYSTVVTTVTVGILLGTVSLVILKTGALSTLVSNLIAVSASGGANDGSVANSVRYQLIDIRVLIPAGLYSTSTLVMAWTSVGLVSAFALVKARDSRMLLAVIATATLLFSYHRFYDAQLLWLAIPALTLLSSRVELLVSAGYSAFLLPGQTIAAMVNAGPVIGPWGFFLMSHESIACLVIWAAFAVAAISVDTDDANARVSQSRAVPAALTRLRS